MVNNQNKIKELEERIKILNKVKQDPNTYPYKALEAIEEIPFVQREKELMEAGYSLEQAEQIITNDLIQKNSTTKLEIYKKLKEGRRKEKFKKTGISAYDTAIKKGRQKWLSENETKRREELQKKTKEIAKRIKEKIIRVPKKEEIRKGTTFTTKKETRPKPKNWSNLFGILKQT